MHDVENQNMEANLDVVLDRLRQGASQEVSGCVWGRGVVCVCSIWVLKALSSSRFLQLQLLFHRF